MKHKPDYITLLLKHSRGFPLFSRVTARLWPGLCICYSLQPWNVLPNPLFYSHLPGNAAHLLLLQGAVRSIYYITLRCDLKFLWMSASRPEEPLYSIAAREGMWAAHRTLDTVQALASQQGLYLHGASSSLGKRITVNHKKEQTTTALPSQT